MSKIRCFICGNVWDGTIIPVCPMCNVQTWEDAPGFIRPKHDPSLLPLAMPNPRSVVTMDFITDKSLYIDTLSNSGAYYYDTSHRNISCVVYEPLGTTAGSAIPAWFKWPNRPLDSQIVVDIFGYPHVYAIDNSQVQRQIQQGRLIAPRQCEFGGCANLAIPGTKRCKRH